MVVRSTPSVEVAAALGVDGTWWASSATSIASLLSPGLESLGERSGEASSREGGIGRALHSLDKALWSLPLLKQWGGEVGQQPETGLSCPPFGQVGFWHRCNERVS